MQDKGKNFMMSDKEIEKQNFLCWYSMYATAGDIEKAKFYYSKLVDITSSTDSNRQSLRRVKAFLSKK